MISAKILIVDDAQQVRRVLRTALSSEGYTTYEAASGEEALDAIRATAPDAILLDVNMPGMGGLEACREIRRTLDVPILMLTVRNSERDKVLALDAGADDYVVKPFGMQELLARIRAALRQMTRMRLSRCRSERHEPDAHFRRYWDAQLEGKHSRPTCLHYDRSATVCC